MPKVVPLVPADSGKSVRPRGFAGVLLALFERWIAARRHRRSLGRIPSELLDDIVADEDMKTRERLRREPRRFHTGIWF